MKAGDGMGLVLWGVFAFWAVTVFLMVTTDTIFVRELGDFVLWIFGSCSETCP